MLHLGAFRPKKMCLSALFSLVQLDQYHWFFWREDLTPLMKRYQITTIEVLGLASWNLWSRSMVLWKMGTTEIAEF